MIKQNVLVVLVQNAELRWIQEFLGSGYKVNNIQSRTRLLQYSRKDANAFYLLHI